MRARNLKPGFFTNERLAEIDPLGRILFAGLWCIADRAGRLEDRPKRLKVELLPYDECDVDALLQQLHQAGFIQRYEVSGERYITVVNFNKHQNPHVKEKVSTILAPGESRASTVQTQCEHQTSTVPVPEIPERARLIPDSLLLIPSIPTTSGTSVPEPDPIFGGCLSVLRSKGVAERSARSTLGKIRKDVGDAVTIELVAVIERDDITDPIPWLLKASERRIAAPGGGKPVQIDQRGML